MFKSSLKKAPLLIPKQKVSRLMLDKPVDIQKPQNALARSLGKTHGSFVSSNYITTQRLSTYRTQGKKLHRSGKRDVARFAVAMIAAVVISLVFPIVAHPRVSLNGMNAEAAASADVWWPSDKAKITGVHPFKALVPGLDINSYEMYWQVDEGNLIPMPTNNQDYPHKEALVDVTNWNWHGNGPYVIGFVAKSSSGEMVGSAQRTIYIDRGQTAMAATATEVVPLATVTTSAPVASVTATTAPVVTASVAVPVTTVPTCNTSGTNSFVGCYYASVDFTNLKTVRADHDIQFDWGGGSPDSQLGSDNFSVRWQGSFSFNSGNYTFTATADDGIRVYVDNQIVIDKFVDQPPTTYAVTKQMSAGTHDVKVEYYERGGGAVAKVSWKQDQVTTTTTTTTATAKPLSTVVTAPSPAPVTTSVTYSGNFYLDPNSNAKRQAELWRYSKPYEASLMDKLAQVPNAAWFGGWNYDVKTDVQNLVKAAESQGTMPILVAYNIPGRDCGGFSAGGAQTPGDYKQWISNFATGIGSKRAWVILEPDSVAGFDCLSSDQRQTRIALLSYAVDVLKANASTKVYIDAGNAHWIGADEMGKRLKSVGIDRADGFALNVSNFVATGENVSFGNDVSSRVNGKHFIVDTSRNGNGSTPDNAWCNPSGRAVGQKPTVNTGSSVVDAFVWGKDPGGSDGECNGGPSAGTWWPDYALGLMQRAGW